MTQTPIASPSATEIEAAIARGRLERSKAFRAGLAAIFAFLSGEPAPQAHPTGAARPAH
ncbi:MAG: hypothetical protein AAFY59_06655 [Pseudomonadota bacterium]